MLKKLLQGTITFCITAFFFTHTIYGEVDIGQQFGQGTVNFGGFSIGSITTLGQVFTPVVWTVYSIVGTIVITTLLYGGFMVIMGSDPKKLEQGKQAITWGLIGLIVTFSSFWIIRLIEVMTAQSIITPSI